MMDGEVQAGLRKNIAVYVVQSQDCLPSESERQEHFAVFIPDGIIKIEDNAFHSCTGLIKILIS